MRYLARKERTHDVYVVTNFSFMDSFVCMLKGESTGKKYVVPINRILKADVDYRNQRLKFDIRTTYKRYRTRVNKVINGLFLFFNGNYLLFFFIFILSCQFCSCWKNFRFLPTFL